MSQIKAQEQHTINHELDAVHSWSPMSNAGWLATKGNHAFKPHELPGVKKAQYEDQKRLLTVYDKEYPSLDKRRNPQAAVVARPRQLIASKWQTPRTRDASGNIQLQTEDVKEPTETERQLYSGRVPQSRLRQFGDTTFGGPANHFCANLNPVLLARWRRTCYVPDDAEAAWMRVCDCLLVCLTGR